MLELNTLWRVIPFVEIFCKFLVWAFNLAMGFTHWNKALVWCIAGWVAFVWNVGDTLMDYSSKNVMNQLDKRWTVVKIMIAWHHSAFIRLRSRRKSIYNVSLLIKQNWYFKYFKNFFRYFLIEQYSIKKKKSSNILNISRNCRPFFPHSFHYPTPPSLPSSHLFSLPFWSLCRVPNIANILKRIRKVNKPFCRTPAAVISARAQPFTLQDKFIKVEGRISYSHHFSFFFATVPPSLEARLLLNKLVCLSREAASTLTVWLIVMKLSSARPGIDFVTHWRKLQNIRVKWYPTILTNTCTVRNYFKWKSDVGL